MDIIIIGAGPSGLMCAINAKNKNNKVTIIEKNNKAGKKLLLTGNGKCNYFNENLCSSSYHSSNEDLIDLIINENNKNMALDILDKIGIYPKVVNGYYYPYSNLSSCVLNLLLTKCNNLGIDIIYNENVTSINKLNNKFIINNKYSCDKLVISTGLKSYSKTGSDGILLPIIEKFGHKVEPILPALVQVKGNIPKDFSGIRINAKISLYENNKFVKEEIGELQFTDYGLSGICLMQLSSYISKGLYNKKDAKIYINFMPFIENFDEFILNRMTKLNNLNVINALESIINYKILYYIFKKNNIDINKKYFELNKKEQNILKESLTHFEVNIYDTNGFDNAQTCTGGIDLNEINLSTMESKLVSNLYFTGEIIDIYGDCGGYNLALCWISGILCGKDINDKSKTN